MAKKIKLNDYKMGISLTLEKGFDEFISSCKVRNLRPATITHYNEAYRNIIKFINPDTEISTLDEYTVPNFIKEIQAKLDVSSQTLFTYARDLKTIMNYFMKMDYLHTFKIQLPQIDKQAIETYTDAELRILLKRPSDMKNASFVDFRDYVIVNFLMSTCVRLNSLINIKIKDVDFDNEVVYVNVTKNRKPLIVPLNKTIQKILKDYLKVRQHTTEDDYLFCGVYGKQLNKKTLNGSLIRYNHKKGIIRTGIHRYRHTAAKKFILANKNPVILQKILGHASLLTTQNYINLLVSDLKKEIDDFDILQEFNTQHIKIKK